MPLCIRVAFLLPVVRTADIHHEVEDLLVGSVACGDVLDRSAPLPESERELQRRHIVHFIDGDAILVSFLLHKSFEHGGEGLAAFQEFSLELAYRLAVGQASCEIGDEGLVASVLAAAAERTYVGHCYVHVIREEGAEDGGVLAALADACADPFLREYGLELGDDAVVVVGCIFGGQVFPACVRSGLEEVAMFDNHVVEVEKQGKFILVGGSCSVCCAVTFSYEDA